MSGSFACGAARLPITPDKSLLPHLRGLRDSQIGGVLDDLYVRVMALGSGGEKALFIAFDLDKAPYPAEHLADISRRTGIPQERILMFAIHTHTAPVTGFRPEEGPNDTRKKSEEVRDATARYEAQVARALHQAVDQALAEMRPALMGYATGESYVNVHRNQEYVYLDQAGVWQTVLALGVNPKRPVDRTLLAVRVEDPQGNPIAFFLNYPVHNCVMHANRCCQGKLGLSGDMGGTVCRFLEEAYEGATALWSSGAAGDVNPLMSNESYFPDPATGRMKEMVSPGGDASMLTLLAARHFADVQAVIRRIRCTEREVPLQGVVSWIYTPGRDVAPREDGGVEVLTGDGVKPYEVRVQLLRLGPLYLYGFSGELCSGLGERLQRLGPPKRLFLLNHNASLMARSGYIFDDETLRTDKAGMLPGRRHSRMLPGYIQKALEAKTLELLKEVGEMEA